MASRAAPQTGADSALVRLDKWLWAARFYKTRSIAREMIQGGKIHYNGQRAKPGKPVELDAVIRLRQGYDEREVVITAISGHRRGAAEAQQLYRETPASIEQRQRNAAARKLNALQNPSPEKRPDKKQRRQIIRFKDSQS